VTLTIVATRNDPRKVETDIEDNPVYQIISRSTIFTLRGEEIAHKTVKAQIAIINLAKYDILNLGTDRTGWSANFAGNIHNGFIHINPNFCLNKFNFANSAYVPFMADRGNFDMATANTFTARYYRNPYYSPKYTVVVGGHIKKMPWDGSNIPDYTFTQYGRNTADLVTPSITIGGLEGTYAQRALYCHDYVGPLAATATSPAIPETLTDPHPGFSIIPTVGSSPFAANATGTWFDGEHQGFAVNVFPFDSNDYIANADIILNLDDLGDCKITEKATKTGADVTFSGGNLRVNLRDGPNGATISRWRLI